MTITVHNGHNGCYVTVITVKIIVITVKITANNELFFYFLSPFFHFFLSQTFVELPGIVLELLTPLFSPKLK